MNEQPQTIAGYRIERLLGKGGMSSVYYGQNHEREVAIKVISHELAENSQAVARFFREAQSLRRLDDSRIVRIWDCGSEENLPYIVMEYLPGKTLETILADSVILTTASALYIGKEVALALLALDQRGLIHRDIKPDNIMVVPPSTVKLTDFGLAKALAESMAITQPGQILGSVYYMSPEQCRGEPLAITSDLYSWGIVLYRMLTGVLPFTGNSIGDIIAGHLDQELSWPATPALPYPIKALLEKALAKQSSQRFASPQELITAIDSLGIVLDGNILDNLKPLTTPEPICHFSCPSCAQAIDVRHSTLRANPDIVCPSCQHCFSGENLLATDAWYAVYCRQDSPAPINAAESRAYIAIKKGTIIGNYRIEEEIGRGGMGIVFRVFDQDLERDLAMKVLIKREETSPEEISRFKRGVKAAARLRHPNIVAVHNAGMESNIYYLTMDYICGITLAEKLKQEKFTPKRALTYGRDVARAISHAHEQGILHRDIKPGNVLLDKNDTPLVMDFGLAKDVTQDTRVTQSGALLGTPCYMSPEQAEGQKIDVRSDVYSIGAMLYELLTGRPPHRGDSLVEVLHSILRNEPIAIKQIVPGVHQDIVTICMQAMHKRPEKRYASARELEADIERFLEGRPIAARPESSLSRCWRFLVSTKIQEKYSLLALGSIVALVLVFFLFAYHQVYYNRALALMFANRHKKAIASFDRSLLVSRLVLGSKNKLCYLYRGVCAQHLGQLDKAGADFDRAIAAAPDFAKAYLYRGHYYMLRGELERAAADYQKAVELEPEHPFGYVYRGELHLLRNQNQAAKKDLVYALELPLPKAEANGENWRQEKARVYFWLALLERDAGDDCRQCLQWLQQALDNGFDDYLLIKYIFPWKHWRQRTAAAKLLQKYSGLSRIIGK